MNKWRQNQQLKQDRVIPTGDSERTIRRKNKKFLSDFRSNIRDKFWWDSLDYNIQWTAYVSISGGFSTEEGMKSKYPNKSNRRLLVIDKILKSK